MNGAVADTAARLISYDPRYAGDFAALNYQWIEEYFAIETEDRLALEDPQGYAIDPGGEIFFVLEGDVAVGTVAMVPCKGDTQATAPSRGDVRVFELAKMAVRPDRRGLGYSHLLMQACIEFARAQQAREIMLVTNDSLAPALGLYTRAGFVPVPQYSDARYERGNLEMRLKLHA